MLDRRSLARDNFDLERDCDKARMTDGHHWRNNGMGKQDFSDARGKGNNPAGVGRTVPAKIRRKRIVTGSTKPKGHPPARKRLPKNKAAHERRLQILAERHPEIYARITRDR